VISLTNAAVNSPKYLGIGRRTARGITTLGPRDFHPSGSLSMSSPRSSSSSTWSVEAPLRHAGKAVAVIALVGGMSSVSGCSDSTAAGTVPLALSFSTSNASNLSLGALASAADIVLTIGGHTVDLQQVQLTVDRAKLERSGGSACSDEDDEHDDDIDDENEDEDDDDACEDVRIGTTTFDLPLGGGVVTLDQTAVRAGTFDEIELRISQARLRGSFDGQPFDATVPLDIKRNLEFSPPLVVTDDAPATITVNVAVATWLINSDGSLIDPRRLGTNSTLRSFVRSRIASSFRAFEDRDRDGREDHSGRG
jgi:hypothetical protein